MREEAAIVPGQGEPVGCAEGEEPEDSGALTEERPVRTESGLTAAEGPREAWAC